MRDGDYITLRSSDSDSERQDALYVLKSQGARTVSFQTLADGRLQAHGYLRQLECGRCHQPAAVLVGMWCEACNG